jgi:transposase
MKPESSKTCGEPSSLSWMQGVSSTGRKLSWMPRSSRQKRGAAVGKTKRGKGTKHLVVVDGQGIPLGSHTDSASPAEIRLLEKVMADIRVPKKGPGRPKTRPPRVIGDKAYDSDPHRKKLRKRGINLLSPHRKNNKNVNRQDDRLWDRYRRRYIVERTFAWLGCFRRLVVRYENHINMFVAFLELGIVMLTLRKCL